MMQIDYIGTLVPQPRMLVRMAMRHRSFPALVRMLVVLIMDMEMLMHEWLMNVLQLGQISGRPYSCSNAR